MIWRISCSFPSLHLPSFSPSVGQKRGRINGFPVSEERGYVVIYVLNMKLGHWGRAEDPLKHDEGPCAWRADVIALSSPSAKHTPLHSLTGIKPWTPVSSDQKEENDSRWMEGEKFSHGSYTFRQASENRNICVLLILSAWSARTVRHWIFVLYSVVMNTWQVSVGPGRPHHVNNQVQHRGSQSPTGTGLKAVTHLW